MFGSEGGFLNSLLWGLSMLAHMILPVLMIIGFVLVVLFLWEKTREKESSPIIIIKERFARGDISREEFIRIKGELN